MKTYEEITKELSSPIPRDEVSLRDGGGPKKFSYLEGWKVIDLLNTIFGPGMWAYVSVTEKIWEGQLKSKYGDDVFHVSYRSTVKLVVSFDERIKTEFTDTGYGDGSDKTHPGKAHELAMKEAVTDGLKRCAKNLGHRMGLALYDKAQENVSDPEPQVKPEIVPVHKPNRGILNKLISQNAKVAMDQKKLTAESAFAMLKDLGAEKKEDLTDEQAQLLLDKLIRLVNS